MTSVSSRTGSRTTESVAAYAVGNSEENSNETARRVPQTICDDVKEKIANHIDIIGPECAVPLDAPFENLKLIAQEVKRLSTSE